MEGGAGGRILVLNVDRDDDLGSKASVSTPLIGREPCLDAAVRLALADPEEADANGIFAAVRVADDLRSRGYDAEVAVLSGSRGSTLDADRRIRAQAERVISEVRPSGVVFVSDGVDDEAVLPIIQQLAPILSVQRVVIRHSGSIEESYEVLARYLRMALSDIRYSRYVLGIPGLLLLLLGALALYHLEVYAGYAIAIVLGIAMVYKGFGLDEALARARRSPLFNLSAFTFAASAILVAAGAIEASHVVQSANIYERPPGVSAAQYLIGAAAATLLPYLLVAFLLYPLVMTAYYALRRSYKALRSFSAFATAALLYYPLMELALFIENPYRPVSLVLLALFLSLATLTALTYFIYKMLRSRGGRDAGGRD
ncbi:MAG: DUF373 family protein [Nitrososphaeria archaeon]